MYTLTVKRGLMHRVHCIHWVEAMSVAVEGTPLGNLQQCTFLDSGA